MKFYFIAGEASGDLHASNLILQLKQLRPNAQFRGWGGDKMQAADMKLVKHYRDTAFMGFIPVIRNLRTIFRNIDRCKADITEYQPDAIVLVDYSGFNLRIAEFAHKAGYTVFYYISPQVWAWRKSRVKKIKSFVDKMYSIIPFEKQFYAERGVVVEYVGHPLLDVIDTSNSVSDQSTDSSKPIIALLPGSRKQEISSMLPVMSQITAAFPDYEFHVAAISAHGNEFYDHLIDNKKIVFDWDDTYGLLRKSAAALVTSGTATVETALHKVPQVVCYKGNYLSYLIVKNLVDIKYISMVNLIMEEEVVTELIQGEFNVANLTVELNSILNPTGRERQKNLYQKLIEKLGRPGASERAAKSMLKFLGNPQLRGNL